ncbi:MAG: phenylhydantoinase [Gemmatimonas sp. SG8_17]|nr:MAG: phenylhydantoinase [Gemmatimonas sp. SG8_17]
MARTLFKHGTIVTASDTYDGDVLVDGELIAALGPALEVNVDRVIDATGKYVLPGGIDVHTHLDMPLNGISSSDDFTTGTIAAAFGGTTAIVDFPTQARGESLHRAFDSWLEKAQGKAAIDYGFHMIISDFNDQVEREMDELIKEGITSFKLFMAYPDRLMLDDSAIFRALLRTGENGGLVTIHAENGSVIDVLVRRALAKGLTDPKYHALTRPARAEAEAVYRAIAMAEMADVPIYIVHLSSAEALQVVTAARDRGLPVYAETCPQYLCLSADSYEEPGFAGAKYVMSPPLRDRDKQVELWRGLARGDIQVVATDHCPFRMADQKELGREDFTKIPGGAPGIETRLSLLFDCGVRQNRILLNRFVDITATSPAKIFGLWPQRGQIALGSYADIVVWDPARQMTLNADSLHMRVDYSPYEGRTATGMPELVMARGRVIIEGERYLGKPGDGEFIKRSGRTN